MLSSRAFADRSSAVPLAWAWVLVIVYASLFPFSGWRWPPGMAVAQLFGLPWPRYFITFDITSNLLAYAPLGWLLAVARLRHGHSLVKALVGAVLVGTLLSYAMESIQHLLPQRVPSSLDWLLNTLGTVLGAGVAWLCSALGWLRSWQTARDRWLEPGHGGALALLVLWPVALLFPAPVPLGVGQVGEVLRTWALAGLSDVPWAAPAAAWLASAVPPDEPLSLMAESLAVMLGLLSPCLLAFAASRPGWRRMGLAWGLAVAGVASTTLSTVLNFGPEHALSWRTPQTLAAMASALVLAMALVKLRPLLAGALGLVALTGLVVLVHMAPADPYFAESLQGWEQGRFVRFHGVAHWLGWLWPYAAIVWLLGRLSERQG